MIKQERVGSMTPNQIRFADEYLKHRNATRAYMAAYPNVKRVEAAQVNGSKLLARQDVREYVDQHLAEIHKHTIAQASEIMEYFTAVMRGELRDETVTPAGTVVESEAKLSDRSAAAEKLARMIGADKWVDRERIRIEDERLKLDRERAGEDSDAESVEIIV